MLLPPQHPLLLLILLLLLLLPCNKLSADSTFYWIYLQNGSRLEGKILYETPENLIFSTREEQAFLRLPRTEILHIRPSLETPSEFLSEIYSLLDQEKLQESLSLLEIALQLFPQDEEFLALKARTLLSLQQFPSLEPFLKQQILLHPTSAKLHFERALLFKVQGEFKKALSDFKRVQALVPSTPLETQAKQEVAILIPLLHNPSDLDFAQEREFFDPDLGNCHDAVLVAQKIQEMIQELVPCLEIKIYLKLYASPHTWKAYYKGSPLEFFRNQVYRVQLNLQIHPQEWILRSKETWKLLQNSALRFLHQLYPQALTFSLLLDDKHILIEGIWAHYREEPVLKIKKRLRSSPQ